MATLTKSRARYCTSGTVGYLNFVGVDAWLDSQSIANNTSVVKFTFRYNATYNLSETHTSSYLELGCYVNNGGYNRKFKVVKTFTLSSGGEKDYGDVQSITVSHKSDGTANIRFFVRAVLAYHGYDTGNVYSSWIDIPTIPRQASVSSAPNFNDEDNPVLSYSNPAGNSVTSLQACISLDGTSADIAYRDISKTGTSYTFNMTDSERAVLRNACTTANSRTVKFYVKTVIGGNTYYSNKEVTLSIVNATPQITALSYLDTNSNTTKITSNNQQIIQRYSTLRIVPVMASLKGATLTSVKAVVNGVTKTNSLSGTSGSSNLEMGTVNSANNTVATITVTDSRGNTASKTVTIIMLSYSLPSAVLSVKRKYNYYNETTVLANGNYSSLSGKNQLGINYQYVQGAYGEYLQPDSWGTSYVIYDGTAITLDLDNTKTYSFKFTIKDKLNTTVMYTQVTSGTPILYIDTLRNSVGINCIPNARDALLVNGKRLNTSTAKQIVTTSSSGTYYMGLQPDGFYPISVTACTTSGVGLLATPYIAKATATDARVFYYRFTDLDGNLVKNTKIELYTTIGFVFDYTDYS